jgi:hypothetical protein
MFNYVPIKHKQMSFVSNGGKFKLYTVLNDLFFPTLTQPRILFERAISCTRNSREDLNLSKIFTGILFFFSLNLQNHDFILFYVSNIFHISSSADSISSSDLIFLFSSLFLVVSFSFLVVSF